MKTSTLLLLAAAGGIAWYLYNQTSVPGVVVAPGISPPPPVVPSPPQSFNYGSFMGTIANGVLTLHSPAGQLLPSDVMNLSRMLPAVNTIVDASGKSWSSV